MPNKHIEIDLNLRKRERFFDLELVGSKRRIKDQLGNMFSSINTYLNTFGLEFNKIELKEFDDETPEDANNVKNLKSKLIVNRQFEVNDARSAVISQKAKDLILMSEKHYKVFRFHVNQLPNVELPSLYQIRLQQEKINAKYTIHQNSLGFYVEPVEKIYFVLSQLLKENIHIASRNNSFSLHLNGDGMRMSRTLINTLNFTFKVLEENNSGPTGQYLLGIFQVQSESYDSIKVALKEIIEKLETIKTILINSTEYLINWTQGGDLKWLANIHGIKAANSNQPCIWCNWSKSDKDLNKTWSISNRNHDLASLKINNKIEAEKEGYQKIPLIKFIAFKEAVVDPLHMCLRITDKLFEKLVSHLEFFDKDSSINLEKRPFLKKLWIFIEEECKISNPFYISKKDSKIKMRSINQNERLQILKVLSKNTLSNMDLLSLFPELVEDQKLKMMNKVLKVFYELFLFVKKDHSLGFDQESLNSRLKKWLQYYLKTTDNENYGPYIHIFVFHSSEFIHTFKNLNQYSLQALEYLNSSTKSNYFRQSNKKKFIYLKQLIQKQNRLEFFHLKGLQIEFKKKTTITVPDKLNEHSILKEYDLKITLVASISFLAMILFGCLSFYICKIFKQRRRRQIYRNPDTEEHPPHDLNNNEIIENEEFDTNSNDDTLLADTIISLENHSEIARITKLQKNHPTSLILNSKRIHK